MRPDREPLNVSSGLPVADDRSAPAPDARASASMDGRMGLKSSSPSKALLEAFAEPARNPLESYRTNTPNGELIQAIKEIPGLLESDLGQRIKSVLLEVNPGFAVSDNHPDFLPLLESLKTAPGVVGTDREVAIGRVMEAWYSQGEANHKAVIFPYAKELSQFFDEIRPWRAKEDGRADSTAVYLSVSGLPGPGDYGLGHQAFAVQLKPEVAEGIAGCMLVDHEFGGGIYLSASMVESGDGSEPMASLMAKYSALSGSRLLAQLDPGSVVAMCRECSRAPEVKTDVAQTGLKKNGARVGMGADVLDVLTRSEIQGNVVKLPGQLDRNLYQKVDEVLNLLGGKWNRGEGGHVFKDNPSEVLQAALDAGEVEDAVKRFQFFPTPKPVARQLVDLADIKPHHRVLEPSAGARGIVNELPECRLDVCELNEEMAKDLKASGLALVGSDFLQYGPGPVYDRIVANPPFNKGQDVAHANNMLNCLTPGGRLVTVMAGSLESRTDKATKGLFDRLHQECSDFTLIPIEEGAFKSSGTFVRTVVLVANKTGSQPSRDLA